MEPVLIAAVATLVAGAVAGYLIGTRRLSLPTTRGRRAFASHGGRLLKKLGDGILASFATASGAVECALEVQRAVEHDGRFQIRVGIHLGEVVEAEGDVHGDGVNIASRIQNVVTPGQIGVSKVVYDNVKNKGGFSATPMGEQRLKNVETPVTLYALGAEMAPLDSGD